MTYQATGMIVGVAGIRLAMETRYSGDIQAAVNGLLDSYQLKSLDALTEHVFESSNTAIVKFVASFVWRV